MADKVINVTVSSVNTKNVAVSSKQVASEITATGDSSLYYSQLAKNWAIGEGLIQNEDYSSKTYAGLAQEAAEGAQSSADTAQALVNDFSGVVDNAITEINDVKTDALTSVTSSKDLALSDISGAQAGALAEIGDLKNSSVIELGNLHEGYVADINTQGTTALGDIYEAKDSAVQSINTLGDDYIDNINATGKGYDNLTHRQLTNCLLEVPQRIKYTLADGVLTIKAGSVVIVPYGVEDLTETYPVGSTFLNDNFKVYDTQYADGKFFVWAELVGDITSSGTTSSTANGNVTISCNEGVIVAKRRLESGTSDVASSIYSTYYNTATNLVGTSGSDTSLIYSRSLPFMEFQSDGTNTYGSVNQVFNGMGYIGSTVWVDKGVKGLIPNGRNEDGTLKNIEFTRESLTVINGFNGLTNSSDVQVDAPLVIRYDNETADWWIKDRIFVQEIAPESTSNYLRWYKPSANEWYERRLSTDNWVKIHPIIYAHTGYDGTAFNDFQPKQPFKAVDYNEFRRVASDVDNLNTNALLDSDKATITTWAMPSGTTKTLTLGASGQYYTAPADGYFCVMGELTAAGGWVNLSCNGVRSKCNACTKGTDCNVFVPAKKGASCLVQYANFEIVESYQGFVFVYAEGAK